jgi:hypothetical protein
MSTLNYMVFQVLNDLRMEDVLDSLIGGHILRMFF